MTDDELNELRVLAELEADSGPLEIPGAWWSSGDASGEPDRVILDPDEPGPVVDDNEPPPRT